MARWKRRLITEGVVVTLLIFMYLKMVGLGWSPRSILIAFGAFAVACGTLGFVIKPDEKFAELTGRNGSEKAGIAYNAGWLFLGLALLAWTFFGGRYH